MGMEIIVPALQIGEAEGEFQSSIAFRAMLAWPYAPHQREMGVLVGDLALGLSLQDFLPSPARGTISPGWTLSSY